MTLAPLAAALMAWISLGQQMTMMSIVAMLVTLLLPSYWLFHERITWRAVVGAFISVIGVSLFFCGE